MFRRFCNIRRWLPLWSLDLHLPFIRIWTELMTEDLMCSTFDYIILHFHIYKWKFSFSLYEKYLRKRVRNNKSMSFFTEYTAGENITKGSAVYFSADGKIVQNPKQ